MSEHPRAHGKTPQALSDLKTPVQLSKLACRWSHSDPGHTCTHTHMHIGIHGHMHTRMCTHAHRHTQEHAYTHARTQPAPWEPPGLSTGYPPHSWISLTAELSATKVSEWSLCCHCDSPSGPSPGLTMDNPSHLLCYHWSGLVVPKSLFVTHLCHCIVFLGNRIS